MFKGIDNSSSESDDDNIIQIESDDEETVTLRGGARKAKRATKSETRTSQRADRKTLTRTLPPKPVNYRVKAGGNMPGLTKAHVLEQRKGFPYTATKLGQIGNVKVNIKELRAGSLIATDLDGNTVLEINDLGMPLSHNVYPCIYHLIMSNGVSCLESGKYEAEECEKAIDAFKQLIEKSCLKPQKCAKYNVLYGEPAVAETYEFIVYQDPDELLDMLEIIEGSFHAGNTGNTRMRKKSIAIIEQLYKTEAIDHDEYVQLYDKFIKYK